MTYDTMFVRYIVFLIECKEEIRSNGRNDVYSFVQKSDFYLRGRQELH